MRRFLLAWAMVLLVSGTVFAQTESGKEKAESAEAKKQEKDKAEDPMKLLRKYRREATQAMSKLQPKMSAAQREFMSSKEPEKAVKAVKEIQGQIEEAVAPSMKKIFDLVKSTKDIKIAGSASQAIARFPVSSKMKAEFYSMLVELFGNDKKVTTLLGSVTRGLPSKEVEDFLNQLIAKSSDDKIKANAEMAKIEFASSLIQLKNALDSNPQIGKVYPELVELVKSKGDSLSEEGFIEQYKALAEKYGDVKYNRTTIAEFARRKVKAFEIRARVKVGKVAPEIEGPDMDGTSFKLSDYRGKVVMLDFWGDW